LEPPCSLNVSTQRQNLRGRSDAAYKPPPFRPLNGRDMRTVASPTAATVTVVIPVHNRPGPVRAAIASALAQSYPVSEIIVVDDGSEPPLLAEQLGEDGDRITLIRLNNNSGAAFARQRGIEAASSEFIAFLDSDDIWHAEKLEHQMPLLMANAGQLVAVSCGWKVVREHNEETFYRVPIESADPMDFASGCWFSPGSTVVLPKAAFEVCGPFDSQLRRLEDFDWFLRFALAGGRLLVVPVIGATVMTGRRATREVVWPATDRIWRKFLHTPNLVVISPMRRRMKAWLDVERAAAARNDGHMLRMGFYLLRSLLLVPRHRIEIRKWWMASPAEPETKQRS
jgi:glycosyltransferase involved in cell wall biosynthesis